MSLQSDIKRYAGIAIFCRNHKNLLDEAVEIFRTNPSRLITFRAKTVWRTAETVLNAHGPRPIYFLPVDDPDACIKYVAQLEKVVLHPTDTEATRELLNQSVPSAMQRNEGLWPENGKPTVRTLYCISHCRQLAKEQWLPFTALRKLSNGEHIDAKFGYSYAIVHTHSAL
jgi:hypothetical protein